MSDNPTTPLREFTIAIEWSAPGRTHKETVIARSVEDAKEIAVRLFKAGRVPDVIVDSVEAINNDQ